jgi:hypothetical protein
VQAVVDLLARGDLDGGEAGGGEPATVLGEGERASDAGGVAAAYGLLSGLSSSSATTSVIPMLPAGTSTRKVSANTASLSAPS